MTDLVIANSEAVRQDVMQGEKLPAHRVMVIHNGIEVARYAQPADEGLRRSLGLREGAPVVGVVANFIPYKGYHFFLEGWTSVLLEFPEAVALLVGEGPLRKELEAQVEGMGLKPSVRFLGSRHDVPALLALMDLLVHPSLEEGFSNAILEAMPAGVPVVATPVGGNPETVVHGQTGFWVPPRGSKALAQAMLWLLEHPVEAAKFGEAGRRRVAARFDIDKMVREHEDLYMTLVRERLASR